jgi:hypothetical protein
VRARVTSTKARVLVGFVCLRKASGPDFQSHGWQTRAQMEQKTHSPFLFSMKALSIQSSGYCAHGADYQRAFGTGCNAAPSAYSLLRKIDLCPIILGVSAAFPILCQPVGLAMGRQGLKTKIPHARWEMIEAMESR